MDTSVLLLSLVSLLISLPFHTNASIDDWISYNQYDTYYPDCPRIRKGWHTLSDEERNLYINGLLKLRENGQQDIDIDEVIAIGSVHADIYAPFTHKTSSYLYWHGYLVWELESRIRNLGDEYSCFGLPFWDFTLEVGHETDPLIFNTGLGGNGDPNDHYNVNGYSWPYTREQYWAPTDCYAEGDDYPICSIKRALRDSFTMTNVQEIGDSLVNAPNFDDLYHYLHISGHAVHIMDGNDTRINGTDFYRFEQSYEPIWYLFHSMVQYHQGIWTDCNDYDQIPLDQLDDHPEAFSSTCNPDNPNDFPDEWLNCGLDDPLHFGGKLIDHEWSFINKEELTVRKLYSLPQWNIVYDLGNGDGFFTDSGLKDYCEGKMNNSWFILDLDEDGDENNNNDDKYLVKQELDELDLNSSSYISKSEPLMVLFGLLSMISSGVCYYYCFKNYSDKMGISDKEQSNKYGTMSKSAFV